MFKRNSPRMVSRCSDANNGIRPNDGERLASLRKQLADPTQNHPVDDQKWHPTGPASSQHDDLLPQHRDLGFQRRARSEQIDDNPKNYSAEIQHPAEDRPILRLTPTGWNRPAPCAVRRRDDGHMHRPPTAKRISGWPDGRVGDRLWSGQSARLLRPSSRRIA